MIPLNWEAFRPIRTLLATNVPHVAPTLPLAGVDEVLASTGALQALVVDGDGTALGLIGRSQGRSGRAIDRVDRLAFMVNANVPISVAASMMAETGVPAIGVASDDRRALGVVTWRELVDWIAREGHLASRDGKDLQP